MNPTPPKIAALGAWLFLSVALVGSARAETTIFFDSRPGATEFSEGGANFSGGIVGTVGSPPLYASGIFSYEIIGPGIGRVTFDNPIDWVDFFYVHGGGFGAGTATAFDTQGNPLGSVASNPATFFGDPANFVTLDPPTAIARVDFSAGVVDNFTFSELELTPMVLRLEEPLAGQTKTGVANLRGWVVALAGVDRVEVSVDGDPPFAIPVGGTREDVGEAFPGYPGSGTAGFSMAFNYNDLSPGQHTLLVRAFDAGAVTEETSVTFSTVGFANPFIANEALVDHSAATTSNDASTIFVEGVAADGVLYDITLQWKRSTQSYQIVDIQPASP